MNDDKLIIHRKHPKGEDGYKIFSVRIQEALVKQIDQIAAESGRTRNELIGIFLRYAVDRCVVDTKEKQGV